MTAPAQIDIAALLPWSEPREVPHLGRQVRSAPATEAFWLVWRDHAPELKASGISVGHWPKESKEWTVSWWTAIGADVEGETGYINVQVDVHENIHIPASAVELYGGAKVFGRYPSPYDSRP
jgi:hypothetical protein